MDPIALVEITDTTSLHCGRVGFVESIDRNHAWVQLLDFADTGDYTTRLVPVGKPIRIMLVRLIEVPSPVALDREKEIELAASLELKKEMHTGKSLHSRPGNIRSINREGGRKQKPFREY